MHAGLRGSLPVNQERLRDRKHMSIAICFGNVLKGKWSLQQAVTALLIWSCWRSCLAKLLAYKLIFFYTEIRTVHSKGQSGYSKNTSAAQKRGQRAEKGMEGLRISQHDRLYKNCTRRSEVNLTERNHQPWRRHVPKGTDDFMAFYLLRRSIWTGRITEQSVRGLQ